MSKMSVQRVGATIEEIHSKMGINAAFKCYMGTYRLLKVIPTQALANDAKKLAYKTKQNWTSTTRRFYKSRIIGNSNAE